MALTLTKARAELLQYVVPAGMPALEADLTAWLDARDRFEDFLSAHRDKVRKKLRSARDDDALLDVRAELLVASLLSPDRRFAVEYEASSGAGKPHGGVPGPVGVRRTRAGATKSGPDLTVTFRQNQRFNVEVTRLRLPAALAEEPAARVRGALLSKLRQLPTGSPNVLTLVSPVAISADAIAAAARHLKQQADKKEEALFTRRGYADARTFLAALARLSAVVSVPDPRSPASPATVWPNPLARNPLPREVATALQRALA